MTTPVLIREAELSDCRGVAQIHVDAWRTAYRQIVDPGYLASLSVERRERMWREAVASGSPRLLVARDGPSMLGWIAYGACRDAHATRAQGEVWALYVAPASWSLGVGRALLQEALDRMAASGFATASLWVMSGNARAIRFYRSGGFHVEADSEQEFELGEQRVKEVRMSIILTGAGSATVDGRA
ncbi:MAG: GNAT family N-acetyltransferase [Betaproteobacteria bacterium]|nr:GNAT family N-acetyltransferase [Betaproteobacteria bacterium]